MAAYDSLKSLVQQAIRTNGNNEITGQVLQNVLMAMIDELGGENGYAGVATPSTNPGAPDGKVFYFATEAGTYTHFDGATLAKGIHLLVFNGVTWSHQTLYTIDSEVTSGSNNLITSGAVYTKIINAINALDATVSKSAGADGLSLSLTETDGKVTSISGSIAPQTYDAYGAASAAQIAASTDATNKVNAAKTQILGDAASDYNTLGKLEDKIQAEASRAAATESALNTAKADKATTLAGYGINDAYTKTEVNGLVSTPHQNYVTVPTYASLPATGSADTIYRVSNYNGSTSQVDASVYSEYAWNGSGYTFLRVVSQIGEVFDITVYNSNTKYADLAAALGTNGANVPSSIRRGGMSVKFVQSYDNKYVQYRLMSDTFNTTVANWQGVDDEPTAGSDNLVKSGGIVSKYGDNESQYKDKYIYVILDDNRRLPFGIRKNGKVYIPFIENPDVDYAKHISEFVQKYCGEDKQYGWVEVKVDEQRRIVEGISTDGIKHINIPTEICNNTFKNINDENWVELNLDANGKLISGTRKNGSTYIAKLETGEENVIPACSDYAVWEPAETTDAFKTPNDRQLVTCSISYQELLDTYYNIYLHKDNQEYRVVRTELGYDSSGDHMIYEYDFIPQNYNRVVMLSAGMNTCELSGIFGLIYLIKNIMENHGTSGSGADVSGGLAYLYKNVRLKVIPVICPGSFDKSVLAYLSYNGVNINRNFNFDNNWDGLSSTVGNWDYKGVSPESEVETQILKKWMRDNAHMSELWIDCHTDVGSNTQELFYTPLSDDKLKDIILAEQQKIKEYYTAKGFSPTNPSAYVITPNGQYGKTRQMFYNFGVPAMMIEQYEGYTGIGGTGMNCEDVDIKNYVLMLRSYILAVLKSNRKKLFINLPNINLQSYIENVNKVFKF